MAGQSNYNEIGEKIQESVKDALNTGDFSALNVEIKSSVLSVLADVGEQINEAVANSQNAARSNVNPYVSRPGATSMSAARETINRQNARAALLRTPEKRIRFNEVGSVSGVLQIVLGAFFGMTFLMAGLGSLITAEVVGAIVMAILTLMCAVVFTKGISKRKLLALATKYKNLCKEKMYCSIQEICDATGQDEKKAIKSVKKILGQGFFPEGYLDEDETTLMVNKEVYNQYLETKKQQRIKAEEELRATAEAYEKGILTPQQQMAYNNMLNEGRNSIQKIHQLNNQIPGEGITRKLNETERVLNEIFDRVKDNPDQVPNCQKLEDYYLPTMLKLVEAYVGYDKVSNPGPEIVNAKFEIENTLDIINQSFVELRNKLYQTAIWDSTAEAKVLQTMLKQDGLASDQAVSVGDGMNMEDVANVPVLR